MQANWRRARAGESEVREGEGRYAGSDGGGTGVVEPGDEGFFHVNNDASQ